MIWMIAPREVYEEWFNQYHPSSLPQELQTLAEEILKHAGSGMRMEAEISDLIQRSRLPRGRQYAEALAICAIFYQESGQLERARENLAEGLRNRLPTHEKAVLSWMMGTIDLLRGRNLQAYLSLRKGVDGFRTLYERKQRILKRRAEQGNLVFSTTLEKRYLGWYEQQMCAMNKVLAGMAQQTLDWMNLKKWGHIQPVTAEWVTQMRLYLEHADPGGERVLVGLLEAGTQMIGTQPADRDRALRMRARMERGDPARVREVIAELLRLAYAHVRGGQRDTPLKPGRLSSQAFELPEVMVICAWGFYEICDYDASARLLHEAIQWFSDANWMGAMARWMLGIVCQQMPGFELQGLAEWKRAAEQMQEHAWRANRRHEVEFHGHFEAVAGVMREVLDHPADVQIPDADLPLEITRINLVLRTNAARFQKQVQENFTTRLAQILSFDPHEVRITRLTHGSLVVTIQLPMKAAVRLLLLYLNEDNRLRGLPEFHIPGIEPFSEEVSMGEDFENMEDELKSYRQNPEVGHLLHQRSQYMEKLIFFQDQRAQLTNPNRATVDIQYDERHFYDRLLETQTALRDFYRLNIG